MIRMMTLERFASLFFSKNQMEKRRAVDCPKTLTHLDTNSLFSLFLLPYN